MKYITLTLGFLMLVSCGSSKKTAYKATKTVSKSKSYTNKMEKAIPIIRTAKSYIGTRYKYGGTTKSGMDCSGLVFTSFLKNSISLPRTSYSMSQQGKKINLKAVKQGDLVFFKTSNKAKNSINHVGVVSKVQGGNIYFIHSTSSKGVIESSLKYPYWNKAFKFAKRVL